MFEIFPCVMNAALDRIIPTRNRYGRLPSLWLTCPSHWLSCKPLGCWWQRKPKNGCTLNIWPTKPLARWPHKNTLKSSYTYKMYSESQFYNLLDSIQNSILNIVITIQKFVDVFATKSNKTLKLAIKKIWSSLTAINESTGWFNWKETFAAKKKNLKNKTNTNMTER